MPDQSASGVRTAGSGDRRQRSRIGNIGIPSKHLVLEQNTPPQKVLVANLRTSMLRFSLEASFRSFRRQPFPYKPRPRGSLSS